MSVSAAVASSSSLAVVNHTSHKTNRTTKSPRREAFLSNLMSISCQIMQFVFEESSSPSDSTGFVTRVLKRSHTSFAVLSLGLFYLLKLKSLGQVDGQQDGNTVFVAALIISGKYLQDKNFRLSTWSLITGYSASDLHKAEHYLFHNLHQQLYISQNVYERWALLVSSNTEKTVRDITPELLVFMESLKVNRKRELDNDRQDNLFTKKAKISSDPEVSYHSPPSRSTSNSSSSSETTESSTSDTSSLTDQSPIMFYR